MALKPEDYTVGWICALAHELAAARRVLDEEHAKLPLSSTDSNSYHFGRVGAHNVVIAVLPIGQLGNHMSSTVAVNLRKHFPTLRFGLFVGIGGGVPSEQNDVRLGDVVVSAPSGTFGGVVQYTLGKVGSSNSWERTGHLNAPPEVLLTGLASYKSDLLMNIDENDLGYAKLLEAKFKPLQKKGFFRNESFKDVLYLNDGEDSIKVREDRDNLVPLVFFGNIASGDQIMKSAVERDRQSVQLGGVLCFEMEAAGLMNTFPCLIFRGISDYCDSRKNDKWQNYAAATAASVAADFLKSLPIQDIQGSKRLEEMIQGQTVMIQNMAKSQAFSGQSMRAFDRAYLYYLKPIPGVQYDLHSPTQKPTCMENTRVSLIQDIDDWESNGSERIYWLNGRVGSGKSTVARTMTRLFSSKKTLGASYFFSQNIAESCKPTSLFRTIAMQLATTLPALGTFISSAASGNTATRPPAAQIEELILTPFRRHDEVQGLAAISIVVVMDALDECGTPEDVKRIIALISQDQNLSASRIRFLVTSQAEGPTADGFKSISPVLYRKTTLHEISPEAQHADMREFILQTLVSLKTEREMEEFGLEEGQLGDLAKSVDGSFTCAEVICRFVSTKGCDHARRVALVVSRCGQVESGSCLLDQVYQLILACITEQAGDKSLPAQSMEPGRILLATLSVTNSKISPYAYAGLFRLSLKTLEDIVQPLAAIIKIPEDKTHALELDSKDLIRIFLNEKLCPANVFVGVEHANAIVAERCFAFLDGATTGPDSKAYLGAQDSEAQNDGKYASYARGYALRFWLMHLRAAGPKYWRSLGIFDGSSVHKLLEDSMRLLSFIRGNLDLSRKSTVKYNVAQDIWKLFLAVQGEKGCDKLLQLLKEISVRYRVAV